MSPYTQIPCQILFSAKNRNKVLIKKHREHLFGYIGGILKKHNCHRYRINGIEEHLHVKAIKLGSFTLLKHEGVFPNFNGGQQGYGAFPYATKEQARLIE